MDSDMGHLSDDSAFGNIYTKIDAKEYARIREQNIREDCIFQRISQGIDRAVEQAEKNHKLESNQLQRTLYDIHARTCKPSSWTSLSVPSSRTLLSTVNRDTSPNHKYVSRSLSTMSRRERLQAVEKKTQDLKPVDLKLKFTIKTPKLKLDRSRRVFITSFEAKENPKPLPKIEGYLAGKAIAPLPQISKQAPTQINETNDKETLNHEKQENEQTKNKSKESLTNNLPDILEELDLEKDKTLLKNSTRHYLQRATYVSAALDRLYKKREAPKIKVKPKEGSTIKGFGHGAFLARQNEYLKGLMAREPSHTDDIFEKR